MILILFIIGGLLGFAALQKKAAEAASAPVGPSVTRLQTQGWKTDRYPTSQYVRDIGDLLQTGPSVYNPPGLQKKPGAPAGGGGASYPIGSGGGTGGGTGGSGSGGGLTPGHHGGFTA